MKRKGFTLIMAAVLIIAAAAYEKESVMTAVAKTAVVIEDEDVPLAGGSKIYVPKASGEKVYSSGGAKLDVSNASEGYIVANYSGSASKVKLQITGANGVTYTYNLHGGDEVFPLSAGSGNYNIGIFENIGGNRYSVALQQNVSVNITNSFGPYLYPNQYVNFNAGSAVVSKAAQLAASAGSDLDVVSNVYNYVTSSIKYDYNKASSVQSGYTSNVDATLASGTGICLDYAAVMASMLRSQGIPTRLEVGYAGTAYHAWISTYITDVGWVNGIIQFDGHSWSLMDPTFAANSNQSALKSFIGNGSNYQTKYVY